MSIAKQEELTKIAYHQALAVIETMLTGLLLTAKGALEGNVFKKYPKTTNGIDRAVATVVLNIVEQIRSELLEPQILKTCNKIDDKRTKEFIKTIDKLYH